MGKIDGEKKKDLIQQCMDEYLHGLKYRNKREADWQSVDELYFGKKKKSLVTRANIHVPRLQGTVETFLSKVDDPPFLGFAAVEEGDRPQAQRLSAALKRDMKVGHWELKDLLAKKEAALYGRTQFKKYSTSEDGFTDYLELVDCLDFVIDPMAGGLDPINMARYMGQDNIIRTKDELSDAKIYNQKAVEEVVEPIDSDSQADNRYRSLSNRRDTLLLNQAVKVSGKAVRLVEWYTTFKGTRYYVLFSPTHQTAVRVEKLKDIFESDEFPFSSWAPFPRSFEYWTPGLGELLKEPNIAQNIILSQILDNNAFRNYGMKAYDVNKVPKPAQLTPRPMGRVGVNGNPNEIIMDIKFPDISNAIAAYRLVDQIWAQESGITPQAKGMPATKRMSATEFAGLLDEVADRFFLANRTYKHALERLAYLYQLGVQENMSKDQRVRILGTDGFTWDKVSAEDAKSQLDVTVTSGATEQAAMDLERDRVVDFISRNRKNERVNQNFMDELEAQMVGLEDDQVERYLNPSMEGDWEILANAESENQEMLKREIDPNPGATSGHIQKHLDFAGKTPGLDIKIRKRVLAHANEEMEKAIENEGRKAKELIREKKAQERQNVAPAPQAPAPILQPQAQPPIGQPPGLPPLPPQAPGLAPLGSLPPIPGAQSAQQVVEANRFEAIRNAPPNI